MFDGGRKVWRERRLSTREEEHGKVVAGSADENRKALLGNDTALTGIVKSGDYSKKEGTLEPVV